MRRGGVDLIKRLAIEDENNFEKRQVDCFLWRFRVVDFDKKSPEDLESFELRDTNVDLCDSWSCASPSSCRMYSRRHS